MKQSFLRISFICAILGLVAAPGSGAPADSSAVVPLDLAADRPLLQVVDGGHRVVPRIRSFGLTSRTGEPMLPIRVLLVAIPEESVPELRIVSSPSETLRGLDIAPVPRARVRDRARDGKELRHAGAPDGATDDRNEFGPDPSIYGREAEFPAAPVRLGAIGYLRAQRYVEVLYSPVLFDPSRRQARFFPKIRAEVRFSLSEPQGSGRGEGVFQPDPSFEDTYRQALVNYEQGKLYRVAAGVPRYKLLVSRPGVYRLDAATLGAAAPDLLNANPQTLMLTAEGVELPISIRNAAGGSGETDGTFDPGDFLEFVGGPKREPPTVLNFDFGSTFPDVFAANDFTDTQVYWLSAEGTAGSHLRIPSVSGAPVNSFPIATDFAGTAVWEENNIYLPLGDAEPFFSIPSLLADSAQSQRTVNVAVPGIARPGATVTVTARLRGGSDLGVSPDHRTTVWINGDTTDKSDFTWDGEVIKEQNFTIPASVLTDPVTIHLSAPGGLSGVNVDRQYPDKVTFGYRRLFAASGDALAFGYPNQDARFQITGFSAAPATIYDVSRLRGGGNEADPVLITGATAVGVSGAVTYTFDVSRDATSGAPATRSFSVAGPGAILKPEAILRAADPVLKNPANGADFILITARGAVDPSPGGALDNLLTHRLLTRGLTSSVVYVDQIYDEFSSGLRDPNAIRSFLAYAFDNWKGSDGSARPPAFVLLVGDASPDYKNTLQSADWVDQVPTPMMFQVSSILGYYSSDNWIASFRGADQIPDIHLGRISTRTAADAAGVFDKIRSYEESPPAGLWKGHAILAAGDGKFTGEADQFESVQTEAASFFSTAPYSTPAPPLYFDNAPWLATDAAGFKNALLNEINAGAIVLSFVGHGSFETWGNNTFFTAQDARDLTNAPYLPFVVNVNCLAGGFHYLVASGSMGEALTNNPSGGAIATFAPSGLSNVFIGPMVEDQLFAPLFGPARERVLGPASLGVRSALWSQGSVIDLQSYTFLGDPATLLATPAPPPPGNLAAVAGNGQVGLSWSSPATAVAGTRIYRAASAAAGPYAPIACDPVSATACVDRSVANATTYYYYAVSIDVEGFGGRASNFNTDCGSAGPDCVSARPLNPGAPAAPTGLAAADPGSGGRLEISWNRSPETDIKTYTLYYGTQPGQGTLPGPYTSKFSVTSPTTSLELTGLTDSFRYYMVLTATNSSGNESAPSGETSNVPHLIQGIAPPRAISDLTVDRAGADLVLRWSRPAVDIYGRPTAIARYNVYRGSTPGFQPFAGAPLATINDPAITTYLDAGAATAAGNAYYIVTAIDLSGLVSGAGRELPSGIGSLAVSVPAAGSIRLAWSGVTTDVQGLPTIVDHYQVYMSSQPLPRSSLSSSTLLMDNVRSVSVDLPAPNGPLYFSVLVVDDRGNLSPF